MITIRVVTPEAEEPTARRGVLALLDQADAEFRPPLSQRVDTESLVDHGRGSLDRYATAMSRETWLVAIEDHHVRGFASGYIRDEVGTRSPTSSTWHVTTIIVDHANRGRGLGNHLYEAVERCATQAGVRTVSARTWSTNHAHLRLLARRGYTEAARVVDERGPGLDSVAFVRELLSGPR